MSILKNTLLYAGWIPALAGGGTAVWWLESDKTIEDVLRRTGKQVLWSNEDFKRVFDSFEGEDQFVKDIENVETLGWKGIAEWCEDKLTLPITQKNLEDFLSKTQKYCTKDKMISNGSSNFKNFGKVFESLKKAKFNPSNRSMIGSITHLGDTEKDDVNYFFSSENEDPEKATLTINHSSNRRTTLGRLLEISDDYEILSTSHSSRDQVKHGNMWNEQAEKYEKAKPEDKIPGLPSAFEKEFREERIIAGVTDGISRVNLLIVKCIDLLKERYEDKQSYDTAHKSFIRWCAIPKTNSIARS